MPKKRRNARIVLGLVPGLAWNTRIYPVYSTQKHPSLGVFVIQQGIVPGLAQNMFQARPGTGVELIKFVAMR